MDSVELVKRAIEFKKPERVPIDFLPPRDSDFRYIFSAISAPLFGEKTGVEKDEWGCTWKSVDATMGAFVGFPLEKWENIKNYKFPNLLDPQRYEWGKQVIAGNPGKYIIAGDSLIGIWERAKGLRGNENFLVDLYTEPKHVCNLLDALEELQIGAINKWAKLGAHGFMTWDDWGMQKKLWIKPKVWRNIFKPRYKKLVDVLHSLHMQFFFHSCGYILDIIPDLIEIGVDVLQLDQPELTGGGIKKLGTMFGGKICFHCPVDIQEMRGKSLLWIREEAKKMLKYFGNFNGGYIAKEYSDPSSLSISQDQVETAYRIFKQYEKYPLGKLKLRKKKEK